MIRSTKGLIDSTVRGVDGDLGKVGDFIFDDDGWRIRYLVAYLDTDTGDKPILISSLSFKPPETEEKIIPVDLTVKQVQNSPDFKPGSPLSRQEETLVHNYYQLPYYWDATSVSGAGPGNIMASYPLIELEQEVENPPSPTQPIDSHLHGFREVAGYTIQANDGEIGKVSDFLVEDTDWHIQFFVLDTGALLPGKQVLVTPAWVKEVAWYDQQVHIDLSEEMIKNSPEYNPNIPLDRDTEQRLYDYYGRPK